MISSVRSRIEWNRIPKCSFDRTAQPVTYATILIKSGIPDEGFRWIILDSFCIGEIFDSIEMVARHKWADEKTLGTHDQRKETVAYAVDVRLWDVLSISVAWPYLHYSNGLIVVTVFWAGNCGKYRFEVIGSNCSCWSIAWSSKRKTCSSVNSYTTERKRWSNDLSVTDLSSKVICWRVMKEKIRTTIRCIQQSSSSKQARFLLR